MFAEIFSKIAIVQGIVGGKVVFLEYEKERPQLRKLYTQKYGFREFPMPSNEDKQRKLGQLFCFLNDDVERNEPKVDRKAYTGRGIRGGTALAPLLRKAACGRQIRLSTKVGHIPRRSKT